MAFQVKMTAIKMFSHGGTAGLFSYFTPNFAFGNARGCEKEAVSNIGDNQSSMKSSR